MNNELQSNEIENLKDSLNKKNEEINKCYNEIKSLKNNELIKEKEEEILKLKKQNEWLEKSINGIFDEKIIQNLVKIKNMNIYKKENKNDYDNGLMKYIYEMDVNNKYNIENKLEILSNFLNLVIEQIVYFDAKLKSQNEQIIKNDIFSDNQKSNKELFNINSNVKEKNIEKDNIINFNFNDIVENSFEELSVVKQNENQNNSNYDFCFSNNNLIINKDIDDYINLKNKIDNIYINKYENNKNYDDNKELIKFEKNKLHTKKPSIDIKTNRISNINNMNKSLSTRQIKYKNFNTILNDKIREMNTDKKKLNFRIKEEEKINMNDALKLYNVNKENNIKNNEIFYISMPSKFTEKQQNIFSKKKSKEFIKVNNFSNISNYLHDALNKKSKNNIGSQTIDSSSRMMTNTFLSIHNEPSLKNIKKDNEINKTTMNRLKKFKNIQKLKQNDNNIKDKHSLIEEVLKPTFLTSAGSSSFLNYYQTNRISKKNKSNDFFA